MNVVDSSGWLEYIANSATAGFFAPAIENVKDLIVPSISLYEVFKRVQLQSGVDEALKLAGHTMQGRVIELDAPMALDAAKVSIQFSLPMTDSIVLATARAHMAILWTQDEHFKGIAGVRYIEKAKPAP